MARQNTTSRSRRLIAGAILIGLALMVLFGKEGAPAGQLANLLEVGSIEALELLPSVVQAAWQALHAYAFAHQGFSPCPLAILVSFWPLLLTMAGTA
ncbi:MAG: hypothetical protein WBL63_23565 [Candidatus Acidiferrum sp.]